MLTIGPRIRLERIRKGVSQAEVARRTGIAQANISKIESGKQDILVSTLLQICAALDVRPSLLFDASPSPERRFPRARLEGIAAAVLGADAAVSGADKKIVALLRQCILPDARISAKRTFLAWSDLRRLLADEAIEVLRQRIEDARQRNIDAKRRR
ncbi:MAG TPA: helix-turn-helix transcriptional regulator [Candidatus Binatia bacterium]|jgi:transcriptional regulator with XRE-family HTH domain